MSERSADLDPTASHYQGPSRDPDYTVAVPEVLTIMEPI